MYDNRTQQPALDPSFGEAAWGARVGAVVGPVQSQFGFHLILLLNKRYQPLPEVSSMIREGLSAAAGQRALNTFLPGALQAAKIVVNPRYGDWSPVAAAIVEHSSFVPPAVDPNVPNGYPDTPR